MKRVFLILLILPILTCYAGLASAQDPIVFPAKGQSNEQMEKDKFECYTWAKNQTGFDPMAVPTATAPPPQQQAGSGGAARGAVAGAAVGAVVKKDDSRSKGAATGAAAGAILGGARQRSQQNRDAQAQAKWEEEQAAAYAQRRNEYNRAYSACLEGKGYTVK